MGTTETTQETKLGQIHISQRVIARLAADTALSLPQVAAMAPNLAETASEKIGRNLPGRGVDAVIEGEEIELTLRLVIYYGCRIPDLALHIQQSVKDRVENLTGCTVTAVHIVVQQLAFRKDEADGK